MSINIFLTGATGYIGGTVFTNLIQNKDYSLSVLVRGEDRAKTFRDLGAKTVVGDLNDVGVIREASQSSDVVINTADVDHLGEIHVSLIFLGSIQAILEGLKQRAKEGGRRPIYIHTSGWVGGIS